MEPIQLRKLINGNIKSLKIKNTDDLPAIVLAFKLKNRPP